MRELLDRGFQFINPCDSSGEITAVVGVRAHDNVTDVLWLRDENDVLAMRMPSEEEDFLSPSQVLWSSEGAAHRVLAELIELPDDRTPGMLLRVGAA
ncbi:hypothetical protein BC739_005970 [Kutzneria viridogrisea]|uniref:Uncharacterized protein n=1 Tax=Kutzneria viridogrisea TaxID=47990 RepID=A0ABR6BPC4_9PSEU|nr:hypothetical protein [Kutzneria albida]MBA8928753.1 hypothetical protein [Kutzneria viridogrisea]